ncbi:MAG TPA: HEAT repeat domain-containing protein, partial [Longimicrobiales bacterium]|nr:HEAT repeat domain-containing protein [Longimicrobiales bacterium]
APGGEGGAGWSDLADAPIDAAREFFVVLAKAFRAYQLYDENNPVRQRFVETLRQAFRALWVETERVTFEVDEDRILLAGQEVYKSENRSDSLAFLFYKDGIRAITFLPGIEGEEMVRFLWVLQRARKLLPEGDDLLTVLWEEDLQFFKYQYVDFLAEGVDLPVPGSGNTRQEMQNVLRSELEEEGSEEAQQARAQTAQDEGPATVSKDDFNPTLYSLDPREIKILQDEIQREFGRDLRGDVLSALFDRLEEPEQPERQSEILGMLGTLLPNFLSRGALVGATRILEELRKLEGMPGVFDEQRLQESRAILDEVSAPAAIGELIQSLYDSSIRAAPQQLSAFLRFLRAGALSPLLRASETVDHKELQAVLRGAVKGIAERNRGALVRLLGEDDPIVASGAARLAGEIQVAEAGPALAGLLAHADKKVRLAAVEAAVSLKASTAAGALQQTLDDPEREVRIAAARALASLRYAPAAPRLAEILGSREIRASDISEKVAFFEAYGMVAGAAAVGMLDKLLNGKGFFGKREPAEIRAAAALALGKVPVAEARAALERASEEDDPVVRSAVNRALRSED